MTKFRLTLVLTIVMAVAFQVFAAGHVETLATFDASMGELTEGVTVDAEGNVFFSITPLGQIMKIASDSDTPELFAQVDGLNEGDLGMLGVAASPSGDIYAAVVSTNPEVNGVWAFNAMTGEGQHIAGSEGIMFPNAVAFGDNGAVYATDSVMGAVWVMREGEPAEVWLQDELITGNESLGFGIPLGANGIDYADSTVYVGVVEGSRVVAIPVMDDGSAGEASVWVQLPAGNHVDGIILDDSGNVIIAAPTSNQVLRANADGSVQALATVSDNLDAPASVAYYVDADGNASIYVANFSIAVNPPGGAGPSIMKLDG